MARPITSDRNDPEYRPWNDPTVRGLSEADFPDEQQIIIDALVAALVRAKTLVHLLTVRQIIEGGNESIEAAGLNPWCINEGLADGSERITPTFIDAALALARGEG